MVRPGSWISVFCMVLFFIWWGRQRYLQFLWRQWWFTTCRKEKLSVGALCVLHVAGTRSVFSGRIRCIEYFLLLFQGALALLKMTALTAQLEVCISAKQSIEAFREQCLYFLVIHWRLRNGEMDAHKSEVAFTCSEAELLASLGIDWKTRVLSTKWKALWVRCQAVVRPCWKSHGGKPKMGRGKFPAGSPGSIAHTRCCDYWEYFEMQVCRFDSHDFWCD